MELTIEQKIKYADIAARVMILFSVIFIGYGMVAKVVGGDPFANSIAGTGLVFVALFGVFVWMKKKLQQQIDDAKTFHGVG